MKTQKILFLLLLSALLSSCTAFQEYHYFKTNVAQNPNYYKMSIRGSSNFFSKSRYYSGYFSEEAIKNYFNDFSQPDSGKLLNSTIVSTDPANSNKELVLILSSNADDIANQINNVTQTQATLSAIVGMANQEKYAKYLEVSTQLEIQKSESTTLVNEGDSIDKTKPKDNANAQLLQFARNLVYKIDKKANINSLDDLEKWYNNYKNN